MRSLCSRSALTLALALFVACHKPPSADPAPAPSASGEQAAVAASASATPETSAAAAASPSAAPIASDSAPPASASADVAAEALGALKIPAAPNGVLPPGAADAIVAPNAKPRIRVVGRGAEPRSQLSYDLTTGATDHVVMGLGMKVGMTVAGQQIAPSAIPRVSMTFDVTPKDKSEGRWPLELKVAHLGIDDVGDPQAMAAARPQLQAFEGMRVTCLASANGDMSDLKVDYSPKAAMAGMAEGMTQSMHSLMIPLPAEAIGVGGSWEVITRVTNTGADLVQIATYTLKSRAGTKASLTSSVTQLAAKAELAPPGQTDVKGHIRSMKATMSGKSDIDFKRPVPVTGSTHITSTMDIEAAETNRAPQRSVITSDMTLDFTPPGSPPGKAP